MDEINLSEVYRGYIACLNKQDWSKLGVFVGDDVKYNGQRKACMRTKTPSIARTEVSSAPYER
jgi:predicted ester cyclase